MVTALLILSQIVLLVVKLGGFLMLDWWIVFIPLYFFLAGTLVMLSLLAGGLFVCLKKF